MTLNRAQSAATSWTVRELLEPRQLTCRRYAASVKVGSVIIHVDSGQNGQRKTDKPPSVASQVPPHLQFEPPQGFQIAHLTRDFFAYMFTLCAV